ncbi:MAG: beta-lactamase family protein [Proteobacteria bacterium]|nr:beta-lactamase family protein [Pseudomonadota bacterium]
MRFVVALFTLVVVTSCASATLQMQPNGPRAARASLEAADPIGVMLGWTPDQTITNFKHLDQLFSVRVVRRGAAILELPNDEPIDPIVPLDGERLTIDQLMDENRVTGVIALHHGRITLERYAHGRTAKDRWFSASVAKSITSTLVGAAIRDGLIGSVDDSISRYIPELKSVPAFEGVTLRHLMSMSSGLRFSESTTDPTSDFAHTDEGEIISGRPPIVSYAMKLTRAHPPGTVKQYQTINADLLAIALSRVLRGRTVSDYLSDKIWRPAGMEADANWVLDKTGIERGGCCISATLRDYARFGLFIAKGRTGPAGAVLPAGWIDEARTPVWPATDSGSGYGWFWWVRQDGGYEAVGAYGQSVTIYPKDDVVIAINAATSDPPGFGIARWRLLQALDAAAVGRPDPNDKTK